jgi:hypothetical protein
MVNIHSITSLITNSSTTLFTRCDDSVEPFKKLINEMFLATGVEKTCDDVFDVVVGYKIDELFEFVGEFDDEEYCPFINIETKNELKTVYHNILFSKEKPDWWASFLKEAKEEFVVPLPSELVIRAKDPKYQKLADSIMPLIESIDILETDD